MSEGVTTTRLSKAAREFNIGIKTVVDFLTKKGFSIGNDPNAKLSQEMYTLLMKEFASEKHVKEEAKKIGLLFTPHETITIEDKKTATKDRERELDELFIKNVSMEFDKKQFDAARKTREQITKEPVKEEKKPEPKVVQAAPAEPVAPVAEPKPVPEVPVTKIPEKSKKAETTELPPTDDLAISPVTSEETILPAEPVSDEKPKTDIKIVGKMDLGQFEKKPSKKAKSKKQEPEQPAAAPVVDEPVVPLPEELEEIEALPEVLPELIEQLEDLIITKSDEPIQEDNFLPTERIILEGPTILGSIVLPEPKKFEKKKPQPVASSSDETLKSKKKKRKRIRRQGEEASNIEVPRSGIAKPQLAKDKKFHKEILKPEVTVEDIEKQIKETLARLSPTGKSKASKYRKAKREAISQQMHHAQELVEEGKRIIKVTEFVTANELASMLNVPVTDVISTCMALGMFVSINQRLDAETLTLVAEEFGFKVEFVSVEVQEAIKQHEPDNPEDLTERPPIVTVMGHVDHGKTKLLDFIRSTNVVAGEAGGITQHIGAYEVQLENGKKITFLDTPGHEAFTAMRARGASVTDVAIIVIAADETVMPQTREAINHALAAGVPIVFAFNKIDKPNANPEKLREELSKINILVEEWGGKYQTQEISAKTGSNVDLLLEKVLLEAEMLNVKANQTRLATGTVIESSLDKGRGYVAKLLVQNGTLQIGDIVLAGATYGKVKAMYNERNQSVREAGPSQPILMLGLNGAPQAGDGFNVMTDEKESKVIATKRLQLQREQGLRTQKHITLDEIGRRIAIGDFKELNIIVKGDVDGSVEALSDSLLKLSTEEVMVNVIHKSVGAITESDVLLASASNAVIVGFQVRPSVNARKLAEAEQIDIRLYSIIYQAIEEIKMAIEGMLSPEIEEKIICNIEVRDVFRITKVGTVAGCMVLDGKVTRSTKIRVIRDGIVVYTGILGSLKRFKEDVKEVQTGYECGLNIENFNDIKTGDIIEGYEQIEIKRKL
ncbi:MAG: translation initiation factor IF-2 [Bacteroidales bacterium]|jgi:translation initiation factor IF-2|nr:translation initiation factor IF-2 [Bacteroidales bacterium]